MSHPPFAHNPHVYNGVDPDGNPTSGLVVHSPELEDEPGPELTDLPDGHKVTPASSSDSEEADDEASQEGGEQPSASPSTTETEEPAGTDSSASSKPAGRSGKSSGSGTRSRARATGNQSGQAETTE